MMMSLAAELGPVKDSGVAVFMYIPGLVGRPRVGGPRDPGAFKLTPVVIGYGAGPIVPEDCGAALVYSIVHAAEIHGSGINVTQAQKRMKWDFPRPDTVPAKDFDRIRNQVEVRMFGYVGPGWPDKIEPLVTVDRSKAPPDEMLGTTALF
jgi:hypothetical protein